MVPASYSSRDEREPAASCFVTGFREISVGNCDCGETDDYSDISGTNRAIGRYDWLNVTRFLGHLITRETV